MQVQLRFCLFFIFLHGLQALLCANNSISVRRLPRCVYVYIKPFGGEMSRSERKTYILNAPAEEVFTIGEPAFGLPERTRIFTTVICENCGEGAPEHKIRLQNGKKGLADNAVGIGGMASDRVTPVTAYAYANKSALFSSALYPLSL